jgi:hypothetical protein
MQTPLTPAQRDQLAAHLAALDSQIQQVYYFYKCKIESSSIMMAGEDYYGKEFKKLLTFSKLLPVPITRLKAFLEQYSGDLIMERNNAVNFLETGTIDFAGTTAEHKCDRCCKLTPHRNYFFVPGNDVLAIPAPANVWICNECESLKSTRQ